MDIGTGWWTQVEYVAPAIGIAVAGLGGLLTEVGPWYKALKAPTWKPPDWAFGPVWTIIITMAVIAAVLAWRQADTHGKQWLLISFGINCALNIAWSWFFFKLKRPDWALIETCFLWLSIVGIMATTYPLSSTATLLLIPYLVWVGIASVLNLETVKLNGPFK